MFEWFKGRQTTASTPAKPTAADVSKIMQQYGVLRKKYPAAPETRLSVPKDQMRLAKLRPGLTIFAPIISHLRQRAFGDIGGLPSDAVGLGCDARAYQFSFTLAGAS